MFLISQLPKKIIESNKIKTTEKKFSLIYNLKC